MTTSTIDDRIEGTVETLISYLEIKAPLRSKPALAPRPSLEIRHAARPTTSFYRYLYNAVGEDWTWTERRLMDDAALAAVLCDANIEIDVLHVDGVPAGYAELDRRKFPEIELSYFGLIPDFIGQGLGRFLLQWTIHHAWRETPSRLWVHTCDLDHPNALGAYEKAGFQLYHQRRAREIVLTEMPPPRRNGHMIKVDQR